jgi:hypothetical protein
MIDTSLKSYGKEGDTAFQNMRTRVRIVSTTAAGFAMLS